MKKKYKIAYTTGVFDMFHIGHLNVLKKSSALAEKLIVGVCADDLAFELKNKKPVFSLAERMAILSEIKCVDNVVVEDSRDKFMAHKRLSFDLLIKGSDWEMEYHDKGIITDFSKLGVDVVFIPYTEEISSTILKLKILQYLRD